MGVVTFLDAGPNAQLPRHELVELAAALDRMTDGIVACDRDWRIVVMNRAAQLYFGVRREDVLGRNLWEVFPPLKGSVIERVVREAVSTGVGTECDTRGPVRGRWLTLRVYPSPTGVSVYFRDITPERQAEGLRRESEERLRSVFENNLDGILLAAPNGEILAANPSACAMLGRTQEELCRLGRAGVVDPRDTRLATLLRERQESGHARSELTMVRADGALFEVALSVAQFRDRNGNERVSISFYEVGERRRAESALRLLADAGAALVTSLDARTTLQNLAGLLVPRLADLCVVDLVQKGRIDRVAVRHRDSKVEERLRDQQHTPPINARSGSPAAIRSGEPELVSQVTDDWLRRVTADEEQFQRVRQLGLRSALVVPLVHEGRTLGAISVGHVTRRRALDNEDLAVVRQLCDRVAIALENARLYAESVAATRCRDEVLGIVSHDLKGPLTAIALTADLLARDGQNPHISTIRRSVRRATTLIEDLLTTARIDEGAFIIDSHSESLPAILGEAVELHRPLVEAADVELRYQIEPTLPAIVVDRHRVLQMIGNLLGNSIKFTPRGGVITLAASSVPSGIELTVADTGPGIAPDVMEHLFDRFWQGLHAQRAGSGLGLAIVKGIVDAHHGSIRVESAVGCGTRFVITLPFGEIRQSA